MESMNKLYKKIQEILNWLVSEILIGIFTVFCYVIMCLSVIFAAVTAIRITVKEKKREKERRL